ncbi:MAG: hypothetical protein ACAI43_21490 [Phycisphaerae bacterium]|nr:hypothetical protein [Tepidisphaeraceae bacterium]
MLLNIRRVALSLTAGLTLLASPITEAATISWSSATTIAGDTDVSTAGSLVAAFNFGNTGVGTTTVNGVQFDPFVIINNSPSATVGNYTYAANSPALLGSSNLIGGGATFAALTPSYKALLGTGGGGFGGDAGDVLTLGGLTVGQTYQFQWWWSASINGQVVVNTTATAGNAITLNATAGGIGEYAIGTFVADAATQTIGFSNPTFSYGLNGFQLRDLGTTGGPTGVPLPPAVWMGLAAGALAVIRSRAGARAA